MNQKRTKALRKIADRYMVQYIKERVLSPEQADGHSDKRILESMPVRGYMRQAGLVKLGIGSRKWFHKQLKKNPMATYIEIRDMITGNR